MSREQKPNLLALGYIIILFLIAKKGELRSVLPNEVPRIMMSWSHIYIEA